MIETLTPPSMTAANEAQRLAAQSGEDFAVAPVFDGFLDRARSEGQGDDAQLREAAEKLVATTLIMPMFEQMRNDPLATKLFHGGRGETIFQQQMDQVLSDRMAGATNFDLVESVYQQLRHESRGLNTNG